MKNILKVLTAVGFALLFIKRVAGFNQCDL